MTTHVAVALLVAGDRVLLGHRHPGRVHFPDCWDAVGGHVEGDESPEEAMVREVREEIGVVVTGARPLPGRSEVPGLEMHVYAVTAWTGEPTNCAPDEHDDLRWFRRDEIAGLRLAHPSLGGLVAEALDALGGSGGG